MGNRNACQPLEARITEHLVRALHQLLGGGAGQDAVQDIHLGQQSHVRGGETTGKAVLGRSVSFRQLPVPHQPGHLLAGLSCAR